MWVQESGGIRFRVVPDRVAITERETTPLRKGLVRIHPRLLSRGKGHRREFEDRAPVCHVHKDPSVKVYRTRTLVANPHVLITFTLFFAVVEDAFNHDVNGDSGSWRG